MLLNSVENAWHLNFPFRRLKKNNSHPSMTPNTSGRKYDVNEIAVLIDYSYTILGL